MNHPHETIAALEHDLVREFRACQSLYQLTTEERQALVAQNTDVLMDLAERKEVLLDEISLIEESRRSHVNTLATLFGLISQNPTLVEILHYVDRVIAERLQRLYKGIETLILQIRDLNQGNRILAIAALEWVDAAQAFLLSMFQQPTAYGRPGYVPPTALVTTLEFDQRA